MEIADLGHQDFEKALFTAPFANGFKGIAEVSTTRRVSIL